MEEMFRFSSTLLYKTKTKYVREMSIFNRRKLRTISIGMLVLKLPINELFEKQNVQSDFIEINVQKFKLIVNFL